MDEILKAATIPDLISFAGGLPNPELFPADAIREASDKVLSSDGKTALQYNITEGYGPLREYIAARYYGDHPEVSADNIVITTGSQQALDMIGRLFINPGEGIVFERPGYLGAIQAFYLSEPEFHLVPMLEDGVDVEAAALALASNPEPKLFYGVTNFQNPTGLTYSLDTRERLADALRRHETLFIEDNPYGEIRFSGEKPPGMIDYLGFQAISLGSFSKVLAPAMRMGWLCASHEIVRGIIAIKGATDMHTNYLSQRVLYQFLIDNDFDAHIAATIDVYRDKRDLMLRMLEKCVPAEAGVHWTVPNGGMFTWMTLPEGVAALDLLAAVKERGMYFIPGVPFYVGAADPGTLRLNYSNSTDESIVRGIEILGETIRELCA